MTNRLLGRAFALAFCTALIGSVACSHGSIASDGGGVAAALGSGSGQKYTFLRKYEMGDKDVYLTEVKTGTTSDITMTMTQTVTKLYDDGSADVSSASSNMKMVLNGKDTPVPTEAMAPISMRLDKYGSPIDSSGASAGSGGMPFAISQISSLRNGIDVGQTVPWDTSAAAKLGSKGTVTFVGIEDGGAKLHIASDTFSDGKPDGHIDGTMLMQMSSGKVLKADMTTLLTGGESSHMTMTRQAS